MRCLNTSAAIFALVVLSAGCVVSGKIRPTVDPATTVDISRLWEEPIDLAARDLFDGPGKPGLMPQPSTVFTFIRADQTGYSPGYDVRSPDGMEWSVKLGPEAQTEVAMSRILWALGYHQPPTYFVDRWTTDG